MKVLVLNDEQESIIKEALKKFKALQAGFQKTRVAMCQINFKQIEKNIAEADKHIEITQALIDALEA